MPTSNTEFIIRTNQPSIAKFLSRAQNAFFTITANNHNIDSNVLYIGNDSILNELYLSLDDKIISFNKDKINLYKDTIIDGHLLPSSCNLYDIDGCCNLYLYDSIYLNDALIQYDSQNQSINFIDNDPNNFQRDLEINAKQLKIVDSSGYYSIFSTGPTGAIISSFAPDNTLINSINIGQASTSVIPEGGSNLYFTPERVQNVLSRFNFDASASAKFLYDMLQDTSNNTIHVINSLDDIMSNYVDDVFNIIKQDIDNERVFLKTNINNYLNTTSNSVRSFLSRTSNDINSFIDNTQFYDDISKYIDISCNNILDKLYITSNNTAKRIFSDYAHINSDITNTSNNIIQQILDTSNLLITSFTSQNTNISDYIYFTSNTLSNMEVTLDKIIDTSKSDISSYMLNISNYALQFFNIDLIDTSNYAESSKFNLWQQFISTSNTLNIINNLGLDDLLFNNDLHYKLIINNIYASNLTVSNLTTIGNLIPYCNIAFDLGSFEYRWHDAYLSGNSIHLDNTIISTNTDGIIIKNANNDLLDVTVSRVKLFDENENYVVIEASDSIISASIYNYDDTLYVTLPTNVTTNTIQELSTSSNLYYKPERVIPIINASNMITSNYTSNIYVEAIKYLNSLTLDQLRNGSRIKFISQNQYLNDLTVNATIISSNLNIIGNSIYIATPVHRVNNLNVSSLIAKQYQNHNIFEFYGNDRVIVLNNEGKLGVGTNQPSETLDVLGSIKFTGKINNINSNQFGYLAGTKSNIVTQLRDIYTNISNINNNTSNNIITSFSKTVDSIQSNIDNVIEIISSNNSNYVQAISIIYKSELNKTDIRIKNLENNISDYSQNVKQYLTSNLHVTSNQLIHDIQLISFNVSNFVNVASNTNINNLQYIADSINNEINDITYTINNNIYKWNTINNNIYFNGNVGINTNAPIEKLDIIGNLEFTNKINNVSSNEFSYLYNVTDKIQKQIDNKNSISSNNIESLASYFQDLLSTKALAIRDNIFALGTSTSNYIESHKSQIFLNTINASNSIIQYFTNFNGPSQWNIVNTTNNLYYENNVGIGTTVLDNKLQIHGGDINITNGYAKNEYRKYQLLRWYDSPYYNISSEKNIDKYITYNEGFVGIGITPKTNLHVGIGNLSTGTGSKVYFDNQNTGLTSTTLNLNNVCAIFESSLVVNGSVAVASDIRIKNKIKDIEDDKALVQILQIQPKKYNYIDILRGTSNIYGFIAQQIKDIIPNAVSEQKEFIPNIYKYATCSSNIIFLDTTNVNIGDKIRIIDEIENIHVCQIVEKDNQKCIRIDKNIHCSNVFVYGIEVDNFNVLDKQYIYTLNVCAIQSLSKKIDAMKIRLQELHRIHQSI